jgi:hypothetical protein
MVPVSERSNEFHTVSLFLSDWIFFRVNIITPAVSEAEAFRITTESIFMIRFE